MAKHSYEDCASPEEIFTRYRLITLDSIAYKHDYIKKLSKIQIVRMLLMAYNSEVYSHLTDCLIDHLDVPDDLTIKQVISYYQLLESELTA